MKAKSLQHLADESANNQYELSTRNIPNTIFHEPGIGLIIQRKVFFPPGHQCVQQAKYFRNQTRKWKKTWQNVA